MNDVLRKAGRFLTWSVAVAAVLVGLVAAFLQTPWVQERIRRAVVDRTNAAIEGRVALDRLGGTLLWSLELEGVELDDENGRPVARVSRVRANYSLLSLAWSRLEIDSIEIQSPRLLVRRYRDGTVNVATLTEGLPEEPDEETAPFEISVGRYAVEGGRVIWHDGIVGDRSYPDIDLADRVDRLVESELAEPVGEWVGELREQRTEAAAPPTEPPAVAVASDLSLAGTLDWAGMERIDQSLRDMTFRLDTDSLARPLEPSLRRWSVTKSGGAVEAGLEELSAEGAFEISDVSTSLSFDGPEADLAKPESVHVLIDRLELAPEFARLFVPQTRFVAAPEFRIEVGGSLDSLWGRFSGEFGDAGGVDVAARASPSADPVEYRADLRADGLRPAKIARIEGVELPDAAVRAALHVEGSGVRPATADLATEFALWETTWPPLEIQRLYGEATLEDGSARLKELLVQLPYMDARAAGSANLEGSFDLRARTETRDEGLSGRNLGLADPPDISVGRADTSLDLSGHLDLDAGAPTEILRRARGRIGWELASLRSYSHRVSASTGSARFSVKPPVENSGSSGEGPRRVTTDLEADGRGLELPGFSVGRFRLDGSARGTVVPSADDPYRSVEGLTADWTGEIRALRTGALSANSASFRTTIRSTGAPGRFRGTLRAGVDGLRAGAVGIRRISGEWRGSARLRSGSQSPVRSVSLDGSSEIRALSAGGVSADRIATRSELSGPPLDPSGRVGTEVAGLTIAGRSFGPSRLDLEAREDRSVAVSARVPPASTPDRPYELDVSFAYNRSLDKFAVSEFAAGRGDQMWTTSDRTEIELLESGAGIRGLELRNGPQRIAVDGDLGTAGPVSLDLGLEQLDLDDLQELAGYRPIPGLDGRLNLESSLRGTAAEPELSARLRGEALQAFDYGPGTISVSVNSGAGWVELEELSAGFGEAPLVTASARLPLDWDLTGDWSFDFDAPSRLNVDLESTEFERVAEASPAIGRFPFEGRFEGTLGFEGTTDDPSLDASFIIQNFSLHGEVGGVRVDLDDVESETTLHFGRRSDARRRVDVGTELRWRNDSVASLSLRTDAPLVEWGADYYRGVLSAPEIADRLTRESLEFSAMLEQIDLSTVPVEPLKKADAEGTLSGELTVSGTVLQPDAEARLDLENFGWTQYRDIYVDVDAHLREQLLALDRLRIEWDAEEVLVAHGTIPAPIADVVRGTPVEDLPVELNVALKPISLMKLSAIDYSFNKFQGTLAGYLRLSGTVRSPELDARLSLRDAQFTQGEPGTVGVWVRADQKGAEGGALLCADDQAIATAEFDFPLHLRPFHLASGGDLLRDGPVQMSIEGTNIPIEQIVPTPLVDDWISDPEGYIQADLQLAGTWERLDPSGSFAIEEGGITLVEFGRRLHKIEVRSQFEGDAFRLEKLTFEDNADGSVRASGTVTLDRLTPKSIDASLRTETFDVGTFASDFTALVTSNIDLQGKLRPDRHDIRVDVRSLNVELPQTKQSGTHPTALSEDIVIVERHEEEELNRIDSVLAGSSAGAELLDARIAISISRDSYVRHPNGFLRFSGDLTANLQGTRTSLSGQINSVKGDFQFLGKDFRLDAREGIVRFNGTDPPNPRLDVVAIHPLDRKIVAELDSASGEQPKIYVRVRGTAEEPTLEMTSEPMMSESEIIYVLMTGRPPSNAEAGQEEGVASQAAAAAGGIFSALLEQKIAQNVPVDVLRFESGDSGLGGSKVRVGKYITSDLYLSSAYEFGQDQEQQGWETRVEWHFAPRWMVEGVYGDQQTGVLNMFWDVY